MKGRAAIVVASLLLSATLPVHAVPYGLLLESNADRSAGAELYAVTYDSWGDVLTNNISSQAFTALDINPLFSSAGFTFDGSAYRLLLESNTDRSAGSELYQVTYNTWADVLANNISQQSFTPLDINPLFSSAGLTWDGIAYRMLLESNADRNSGSELYALTYNTWGDVLTNTISAQGFLPLDLNPLFSAADLTWDGTAYRLMLESNADRSAGAEFYQVTYNTWADVLANNISDQSFTSLDINPLFSAGGFAALSFPTSEPPRSVPEPSALVMLMLGLAWLAARRYCSQSESTRRQTCVSQTNNRHPFTSRKSGLRSFSEAVYVRPFSGL